MNSKDEVKRSNEKTDFRWFCCSKGCHRSLLGLVQSRHLAEPPAVQLAEQLTFELAVRSCPQLSGCPAAKPSFSAVQTISQKLASTRLCISGRSCNDTNCFSFLVLFFLFSCSTVLVTIRQTRQMSIKRFKNIDFKQLVLDCVNVKLGEKNVFQLGSSSVQLSRHK